MSREYRHEIDGLRCIAVILVILYHSEFNIGDYTLFTGGFIGVDIFFVISGYLITSLILKDLYENSFSILFFYERRFRRIIPVFVIVLIFSLCMGWIFLVPGDFKSLSFTSITSIVFGSNILFSSQDNYLLGDIFDYQLLHTWSLSVEEQFYLLFPIFLIFIFTFYKEKIFFFIFAIFIISLLYTEYNSYFNPQKNFYLLQSRLWELLAGSILAFFYSKRKIHTNFLIGLIPITSLIVIIFCAFYFNSNTRHPSLITMMPIIATMAIIWYSDKNYVATKTYIATEFIFKNKIIVYIGLISYSLFLWHFPIFSFYRVIYEEPSNYDNIILIIISIILSVLTFVFIERPARDQKKIKIRYLLNLFTPLIFAVIFLSTLIYINNGYPERTGSNLYNNLEFSYLNKDDIECFNSPVGCYFDYSDKDDQLILLGDSKAHEIQNQINLMSKDINFNFYSVINNSCGYIKDAKYYSKGSKRKRCNPDKTSQYLENTPPSIVIYRVRWEIYKGQYNEKQLIHDLEIFDAFKETFRHILDHGHKLVIIFPTPEVYVKTNQGISLIELPQYIKNRLDSYPAGLRNYYFKDFNDLIIMDTNILKFSELYNSFETFSHPNLYKYDPMKSFCSVQKNSCLNADKHALFYRDEHHLTPEGSDFFMKDFSNFILTTVIPD